MDASFEPESAFNEQEKSETVQNKDKSIKQEVLEANPLVTKRDVNETKNLPEDALPLPTMEDVERLEKGGSVMAFLVKGVSSEVKKAALRKLFQGAAFNVTDGLDDYDLDYSNSKKLSVEMVASVRQWTRDKVENIQEKAVKECARTMEEKTRSETEPSLTQTSPSTLTENETKESETKSTHDKDDDILSIKVSQNVSRHWEDKNSDGS